MCEFFQLTIQNTEGNLRVPPNRTWVVTLEPPTKENRGLQGLVPLHNGFLSPQSRAEKVRTGSGDFTSFTQSINRPQSTVIHAVKSHHQQHYEGVPGVLLRWRITNIVLSCSQWCLLYPLYFLLEERLLSLGLAQNIDCDHHIDKNNPGSTNQSPSQVSTWYKQDCLTSAP